MRTRGWASEAEITQLANSFGVRIRIVACDAEGNQLYPYVVGIGGPLFAIRRQGNHYDAIAPDGSIIQILGDGNCGFAAFFRVVTGRIPESAEVAGLREMAVVGLGDDDIAIIMNAADDQDADLARALGGQANKTVNGQVADSGTDELEGQLAFKGSVHRFGGEAGRYRLGELPELTEEESILFDHIDWAEMEAQDDARQDVAGERIAIDVEGMDDAMDEEAGERIAVDVEGVDDAMDEEAGERIAIDVEGMDDAMDEEAGARIAIDVEGMDDAMDEEAGERIAIDVEGMDDAMDEEAGERIAIDVEGMDDAMDDLVVGGGQPMPQGGPALLQAPAADDALPEIEGESAGEELLDLIAALTDLSGNVGTEGHNNAGGQLAGEVFEQVVNGWFGSQGDILLSGISDAGQALADGAAIGIVIAKALKTLRDDESSPAQRVGARLELVQATARFASAAGKLTGGTYHALSADSSIASSPDFESVFDFAATGGDSIATDAKLVGDVGGAMASVLGIGLTVVKLVDEVQSGELLKGGSSEATGRIALRGLKLLSGAGGSAKAIGLIVGQIQGGGQIASGFGGAAFDAVSTNVVPGLGAAVAAANVVRQSYLIHKLRKRIQVLTLEIDSGRHAGGDVEAMQFILENITKRIKRAAIDIGTDLVAAAGSIVQASGVGAGPGMALSVGSSATKLGFAGHRAAKQSLRNRSAKKRQEQGKHESYADWEARQKSKTGGRGVKARLNRAITMNWSKSTEKKARRYLEMAQRILAMDSDQIFRTMGLKKKHLDVKSRSDKLDVIVDALRRR
ncbi:hypothetical protein ACUNV4_16315 [Granulosicoccus sp. 3-233]|uniref:hypothetical protein n=1 Tax=Granulosicoccus sp. 3-233 TaxID=3417969 RepID=UPI003D33F535